MKKVIAVILSLACVLSCTTGLAYELRTPIGEYPLTTEKVTLTVLLRQDTLVEDYETNAFTKWIEETTGVDLTFELLPANEVEALNKLSIMVSSGQKLPDIIDVDISLDTVSALAPSGAFIPLNEYIGVITPNFDAANAAFPEYEMIKYSTAADGMIYGLPIKAGGIHDEMMSKLVMNKKWLEVLGMEVPTTTEEFYEVLKAMKERDPNGNEKQDEYPLVGSVMYDPAVAIMNAFIYDDNNQHIVIEDGVITPAYTQNSWREGLRYLNRLCSENLLAPISYTQDFAQQRSMVNNEEICIVGAFQYYSQNMLGTTSPYYNDFTIIAPLKGPEGVQYASYNRDYAKPQWFVTKDCQYPELAVRVGDLLYSDTAALMNRFGVEGRDYTLAKEGDVCCFPDFEPILMQTNEGIDLRSKVQNTYWCYKAPGVYSHLMNSYIWNGDELNGNWRIGQGATYYYRFRPAKGTYLTQLLFTEDEVLELAGYKTSVLNYANECKVRFITGDLDVEKDWDSYLQELEANGLNDYMRLLQTVYDRQK